MIGSKSMLDNCVWKPVVDSQPPACRATARIARLMKIIGDDDVMAGCDVIGERSE
jgi:hypothetical protein